jgi:hypothetical protein
VAPGRPRLFVCGRRGVWASQPSRRWLVAQRMCPLFFRELTPSRARGSFRSRVLRSMGTRGACFTSSRPRAAFSRRCPIEGCFCLEPGARAARGFCVAWVPAVPSLLQAGPGRPSHADIPSRAVFVSSWGFAPLESSPCLARDRVIKRLTVEAAVFCSAGASF